MAGCVRLKVKELGILVAKIKRLYNEGKTPEEIADIIERPITEVNLWIDDLLELGIIKKIEMSN